MNLFKKLWNGEVGNVVEGSDWDDELDCIVIDDTEYEMNRFECDIDEFLKGKDLSTLVLYEDDGYRGVGCYSGSIEVDGKMYSLDIVNEYQVNGLDECS